MSRGKSSTPTQDWLLAAWQWAAEVGSAMDAGVQFSITPTKQPGVWRVVARLLVIVDGKPQGTLLQVSGNWPNSERIDFGAYLLTLIRQLDHLAEEDAALLLSGGRADN